MAEVTQTDVTNSNPVADATQTDAPVVTDNPSSTTETPATETPQADPLGDTSLLGDDAPKADEPKAEGDAEGDADPDAEAKAEEPSLIGAPEGDYDLTPLLPEGMAVDAEALAAIEPTARELNLSNDGLAKLALTAQPIIQKQVMGQVIDDVMAQRRSWDVDSRASISGGVNSEGETVAADPAFNGKTLDQVVAISAKAIDRFAGDKLFPNAKFDEEGKAVPGTFRDFLKTTGLGNHPAMLHMTYLAGAAISEDTDFETAGGIPNAPLSREEKYYPKT